MLYPNEEIQGIVAVSGENINTNIFPQIDITFSFTKGNDNKKTTYSRTITFKRTLKEKNQLSKIEEYIEAISYSNNRLANYIEGRTLYVYDKINVLPHNSLFKDMKDAINNIDRDEPVKADRNQKQILIEKSNPSQPKTFTYSRKQLKENAGKILEHRNRNRDIDRKVKKGKEEIKI
ncbi:MAG: hypothetical protein K2F81_02765 [Ruminococcus sp.]|nr:hypothetical protein [Ruminococcus sp.]